jgi:predicted PurR-regulated permease PerM
MFGSTILDAAIAMVFIYLLTSLIVSAANELIASVLKLRAKNLFSGIKQLLQEGDKSTLASTLYQHPLISGLAKNGGKPSYIPSRTFALAFLDVIAPQGTNAPRTTDEVQSAINNLPQPLKKALTTLFEEAGHDVEQFKTQLEVWFNNTMERVSGWYKRRTQWIQLVFAIVFAVCLNIDSVHVGQTLFAVQSPLREALVEQAKPFLASHNDTLEHVTAAISTVSLPIGWAEFHWKGFRLSGPDMLSRVPGWLITALAVSLGAPFWFDLLNKFINIRGAGKAPEEQPKEPKELPQPKGPGG